MTPCAAVLLFWRLSLPANVVAGDEAFLRIDYPAAAASYEEQLQSFPNDAELLWRLARVYVCSGEVKESGEGEPLFRLAERYARQCVQIDSLSAEGHTWLAASLGYRALTAGLKEQVRITNEMHDEIQRAIALDPENDAAYSMLGSLFRALGNVGWLKRGLATLFVGSIPDGDFERAEAALQKAIALAPSVMRHQYELGVLYFDWDRKVESRKAFERAVSLPFRVAIDRPRLEKIKSFLAILGDAPSPTGAR